MCVCVLYVCICPPERQTYCKDSNNRLCLAFSQSERPDPGRYKRGNVTPSLSWLSEIPLARWRVNHRRRVGTDRVFFILGKPKICVWVCPRGAVLVISQSVVLTWGPSECVLIFPETGYSLSVSERSTPWPIAVSCLAAGPQVVHAHIESSSFKPDAHTQSIPLMDFSIHPGRSAPMLTLCSLSFTSALWYMSYSQQTGFKTHTAVRDVTPHLAHSALTDTAM